MFHLSLTIVMHATYYALDRKLTLSRTFELALLPNAR